MVTMASISLFLILALSFEALVLARPTSNPAMNDPHLAPVKRSQHYSHPTTNLRRLAALRATQPSTREDVVDEVNSCTSNADCTGQDECKAFSDAGDFIDCSPSVTTTCFCFKEGEQNQCDKTSDCPGELICVRLEIAGLDVNSCVPKNVASLGNLEEVGKGGSKDKVCIDARALQHLSMEELVFRQHSTADVLCDSNRSCATPGHIVVFRGTAMMMKTYCQRVGCEAAQMDVNSPTYKPKLRVKSNTDGLQYTAFAARYETRAEEVTLSAAVHIGF